VNLPGLRGRAYALKKKGVVDEIVNAYRVATSALEDEKTYQIIMGEV
jgi:hypothetical protein